MNKKPIVVIACTSTKNPKKKNLFKCDGKSLKFFAKPELIPRIKETTINSDRVFLRDELICARPDDKIPGKNATWKERLININKDPKNKDRVNLLQASELYLPKDSGSLYEDLFKVLKGDFYLHSPGWGIIRGDFLLPNYDIDFIKDDYDPNELYKFRGLEESFRVRHGPRHISCRVDVTPSSKSSKGNAFKDINQLLLDSNKELIYLAPQRYIPNFLKLTDSFKDNKISIYVCSEEDSNCEFEFLSKDRSNVGFRFYHNKSDKIWYYKLAKELLENDFQQKFKE